MQFVRVAVNSIEADPLSGHVRGRVIFDFEDRAIVNDPPFSGYVEVGLAIAHDGSSTVDRMEAEFLRAARSALSAALAHGEGEELPALRRRHADQAEAEEAARMAQLQEEIRSIGS